MYCIQKKLKLIKGRATGFWLLAVGLFLSCGPAVDQAYRQTIAAERMALNEQFFDPNKTPLDSLSFYTFGGLKFFPIQEKYRVNATLTLLENEEVYNLPHSHDQTKPYKNYAIAKFELDGKNYELIVLEQAVKKPGNENYLLLPFLDQTTNKETYGGGRYIDLDKSAGKNIVIDFNKAYHPYCAYNSKYTCPIPPPRNRMDVAIEAGVRLSSP